MSKKTISAITIILIALVFLISTAFKVPPQTAPIHEVPEPMGTIINTPAVPIVPIEMPPIASTTQGYQYIAIHDGCNWTHTGGCVNMRQGPGLDYPVIMKLRNGMVLQVASTTIVDGVSWYQITFNEWLRYPERITSEAYVADTDSVEVFYDVGRVDAARPNASTTQKIVIDISDQTLTAYDGDQIFMLKPISTGLELTPTPRGNFFIFKKTPSRYMQGPIPELSDQYYDLPGVPWDLYFSADGAVIHGAYWHENFGEKWSHGCVNLAPETARILYQWVDVGAPVIIQD